jgi:hypothetical protein
VNVTELLDALSRREDVEVVVAGEPEGRLRRETRDLALYRRDRFGKRLDGRLRHQEVDVFGHDDIAVDVERILFPSGFEDGFKERFGSWGIEVRESVVTTESEEVEVSGGLVAMKRGWHRLSCPVEV